MNSWTKITVGKWIKVKKISPYGSGQNKQMKCCYEHIAAISGCLLHNTTIKTARAQTAYKISKMFLFKPNNSQSVCSWLLLNFTETIVGGFSRNKLFIFLGLIRALTWTAKYNFCHAHDASALKAAVYLFSPYDTNLYVLWKINICFLADCGLTETTMVSSYLWVVVYCV